MNGFVKDIEDLAIKNEEFRRVLYTAKHCQLVVMALKPKEEIGMEVHKLDQFFRVEEGSGEAVLDGVRTAIQAGFAVIVPAGTTIAKPAWIGVRTPSRTASPVPSSTRKNWSSLCTSAPISSLGFNAMTTSWQCFAV